MIRRQQGRGMAKRRSEKRTEMKEERDGGFAGVVHFG